MNGRRRKLPLKIATTMRLAVFVTLVINCSSIASGQWVEDFGRIGAVRILKGQVRDGLDAPIPDAKIEIIGIFKLDSLAGGRHLSIARRFNAGNGAISLFQSRSDG
jgi:hypothetical protein